MTDPQPVDVPTVLNPEAIGDPEQSPVVQLPPDMADEIRRELARRAQREGSVTP